MATQSVLFLLSASPVSLREALAAYTRTATVEAEYGEAVVEGNIATFAHHGPRQGNLCPCLHPNREPDSVDAVGLSHVDLDTLGGCAALLGCKPDAEGFWNLTAFVDVSGAHKIPQSGASPEDIRRLNAFCAWYQKHRVFAPRDGSVADVTAEVIDGIDVLRRILADDHDLLADGDRYQAEEATLNARSFVRRQGDVIVRKADVFTNHLYTCPDAYVGKCVVALNTKTGGITVSLADPIPGVSCRLIVQGIWGDKAGGHDGIAGSPRDQQMTDVDLERAVTRASIVLIGVLS